MIGGFEQPDIDQRRLWGNTMQCMGSSFIPLTTLRTFSHCFSIGQRTVL